MYSLLIAETMRARRSESSLARIVSAVGEASIKGDLEPGLRSAARDLVASCPFRESAAGVMDSKARHAKQRAQVLETVRDELGQGETVVAVLPFASPPKRPKGPSGKVREGIYTSYRRYRPLVVTSRRLLVVDAGRTPFPRGLLAEFPLAEVRFVDVVRARFGQSRLRLDLRGVGTVPFDLGRYDVVALSEFRAAIGDR